MQSPYQPKPRVPSAMFQAIDRHLLAALQQNARTSNADLGLTAFTSIRAREGDGAPETASALALIPEVLEVHHVAGEGCIVVKLKVRDTDDLSRPMRERISAWSTVEGTRTTIVLSTEKEAARLPLCQLAESHDEGPDGST